jgi:hypothetical protein
LAVALVRLGHRVFLVGRRDRLDRLVFPVDQDRLALLVAQQDRLDWVVLDRQGRQVRLA